jgi:hypothetical protein
VYRKLKKKTKGKHRAGSINVENFAHGLHASIILGDKPMPRQMKCKFGVGYVHDISHSIDREMLDAVTVVLHWANN